MATAEKRQAERGSIVQSAAVDYITMTTRNTEQYELVKAWINREAGTRTPKAAKSYMFDIENVEFASYGEGLHNQEPIYIINVNGIDSDNLIRDLITNDAFRPMEWNCSRIDIQLTVPSTRQYRLTKIGEMYHDGELGKFADEKATAKVRYWGSGDGDSLYIGAPTSMLQIRIYDKRIIIGEVEYVFERFEGQLRDDYALAMFQRIFKNRMQYERYRILSSIKYYHNRLPIKMQEMLSVAPHLTDTIGMQADPVTTDKQERARVRWALRLKRSLAELASEPGDDGYLIRQMLMSVLVSSVSHETFDEFGEWRLLSPRGEIINPLTMEE